jgi:hypothetical protein
VPLYEYYDPETGVRVEIRRKVEDRNKPIVLTRPKTVPDNLSIHGLGPTPDQAFNNSILNGWYAREQKDGTNLLTGEFTKEQIKQAWTTDGD